MLGLGFGEILIILIVGIVVVGPRRLPALMRTAGRWVSKLRRMTTDLRSQSGIDDLIRLEGLEKEIESLRSLSRVNVMNSIIHPALAASAPAPSNGAARKQLETKAIEPLREREYPLVGCDAYDAMPDDVVPYVDSPPLELPSEPEAQA
jgi:sec-independent protein translocase protein TatB